MKIKVYSLLTLQREEVQRILPDAVVASPIQRGDLLKDICLPCNVVVIIDGRFHQSLAVSPAEIMDAMRCGIRIYGASSMGALRAAELEFHGMIGCGQIFEFIKGRKFFRDDFLGQSFDPATGRPISTPFIDFIFNLENLVSMGTIDRKAFKILSRAFAALHYSDRNLGNLKARLRVKFRNATDLLTAAEKAFKLGSQKQRDAIETLLQVHRVTGDAKYLEPIPRALEWLKRSRLPDGRLARYYGLRTNKPLYMTADYRLTNSDANVPQHYGWKTTAEIETLEAGLQAAKAGRLLPPAAANPTEAQVRKILQELDTEGRWVSTYAGGMMVGQPKFAAGFKFLASEVFNRNLEKLSDYVVSQARQQQP